MAISDLIDNVNNCQITKLDEFFLSTNLTFGVLSSFFIFIFFIFLYILYKSYWSGVFYAKELTEIGYDHLPKGKDRLLHINRAQRARKLGSKLLPPYPNGWFALVESRDLKVGGVVAVDALGLNLCVYRGEDGTARIVDAYCPHMGANLAVGGNVCGNYIECPFHQWKFGEDGQCVSIPQTETVPKGVSIKTYPSLEIDGSVWVWYDVEGRPPLYTVDESEETKTWGYRGRSEFFVNAHIQEIIENGADVDHFNVVHNKSLRNDVGYEYPFLNNIIGNHKWSAEWSKGEKDHMAQIKIADHFIMMKCNVFHVNTKVNQTGPAHARLRLNTPLGPVAIIISVTPIAPMVQKVIHRMYTPRYNAILGAAFVFIQAYQFARDVAIWNNKRYVSSPAYVKSDKTIRM